jgi:predicted nucleic acid-binding protein
MKVVLDTNVLIAAFIARGACNELFEHCLQHHRIVASPSILTELREHLAGSSRVSRHSHCSASGLCGL